MSVRLLPIEENLIVVGLNNKISREEVYTS